MTLEFCGQIFEKFTCIKFYENPSSESRIVPCVQTDMTKLIVAFPNFANAPKNINSYLTENTVFLITNMYF